jgi:hypothetical protein
MDSTHIASLDIPELSEATSVAHVLPSMAKDSLISVRQLCNEGYYVTFKIDGVTIFKDEGKSILKGNRDMGTGVCRINLRKGEPQTPISTANNLYELCNTGVLVNYLHNAMFSTTKEAFIKAMKQGNLTTFPGITEEAINKHLKLTQATEMGHMNKKDKTPVQQASK